MYEKKILKDEFGLVDFSPLKIEPEFHYEIEPDPKIIQEKIRAVWNKIFDDICKDYLYKLTKDNKQNPCTQSETPAPTLAPTEDIEKMLNSLGKNKKVKLIPNEITKKGKQIIFGGDTDEVTIACNKEDYGYLKYVLLSSSCILVEEF